MPYCGQCDRLFNTENGYWQHINTSAAHDTNNEDWECEYCDRSFYSEYARDQHHANTPGHPYCTPCKRMFHSQNSLQQHLHSRVHVGSNMQCPWCKEGFATASGVTIHLESGRCTVSGLDRTKINKLVRKLDRNNVITKPMLTMPGYGNVETFATERAWNGYYFECALCHRSYDSLSALNQHLKSPAHDQKIYRCPKAGCNREYKVLSGLVQHIESESCGLMRFSQVQSQAKRGVDAMVGRMIGM